MKTPCGAAARLSKEFSLPAAGTAPQSTLNQVVEVPISAEPVTSSSSGPSQSTTQSPPTSTTPPSQNNTSTATATPSQNNTNTVTSSQNDTNTATPSQNTRSTATSDAPLPKIPQQKKKLMSRSETQQMIFNIQFEAASANLVMYAQNQHGADNPANE